MSDSESSELIDSEAGLDMEEDEQLTSTSNAEEPTTEGEENEEEMEDAEGSQGDDVEEAFYDDGLGDEEEEEADSSADSEGQAKLTEDELRRIHMDDFSSDDEEAGNTIGNIPLKWYDKYDHIGYDLNGEKIMRPKKQDHIDKYIKTHDKNERWTIYDEKEGKEIHLTPRQIEIIKNIQNHRYAEPGYNDETEYIPYFSGEASVLPWVGSEPPKSHFTPSKGERRTINKILKGIREGRYKPREKKERAMYDMWASEGQERKNAPPSLMAPKLPLPDHSESYNPPEEYLPSEQEKREWEEAAKEDREKNYLPQKFSCLRRVPLYSNFVRERYERCLDLYLCPRTLKRTMNIDRRVLLPQLPNVSELRPFPTTQVMEIDAHQDRVRAVRIDATGFYVASGGDDQHLIVSELITGRVMLDVAFPDVIQEIRWNPAQDYSDVLAVACGSRVYFLDTELSGDEEKHARCQELLHSSRHDDSHEEARGMTWHVNDGGELFVSLQNVVTIVYTSPVKDINWHHKGDYVAVNASDASSSLVYIHQLSKKHSQIPIAKLKGLVQRVQFSPAAHPYLFVATQTEVKIYNLVKQTLVNKLKTGCKWVSTMAIHPCGDNLIVGSYDARLSWFDLDLASTPFKTLRYHKKAIRNAQFHAHYPLMSTCSDDGTVHVFHDTVYNDFIHNALIVPLKVLRGHTVTDDLGVLDTDFHPTQPWIVTAGADHTIRLFVNIP
ncbi:hypothetical protein WA577_003675 [Blastocystis sp. JDR]